VADTEWNMATDISAAVPAHAPGRPLSLDRLSDELLARQVARGSGRAFAALYERYHQPLYRYCRSIVRDDADAQDVLQSTFTAALLALRRERRNAPLRPWLFRIARNESITLLRHRSRERDQEINEAAAPAASSAEDQAAGRARWALLVRDLAGLPERQRSALLLREMSGLSHEEIAIALGTNVGAAKQAIFEARQGLTELAEGRAMSCDDVRRRLSAGDRRMLRGRGVRAHLRDCSGCTAFAAAIDERTTELRGLAPTLPSSAAAVVLTRALGAATSHGGPGAAAGLAAGAGAAGKLAGTTVTWKVLTGVAVVAGATVGVTGIQHVLRQDHAHAPPASMAAAHRAAAADRVRAAGPRPAVPYAAGPRMAARPAGPNRRGHRVRADGLRIAVAPAAAPAVAKSVPKRADHGNAGTSRTLRAAASPGHADGGVPREHDPAARGHDPAARGHDPAARGHDPAARGHDPAARGHGSAAAQGGTSTHGGGSSRRSGTGSTKPGSPPGKARGHYRVTISRQSEHAPAGGSSLKGAGRQHLAPAGG